MALLITRIVCAFIFTVYQIVSLIVSVALAWALIWASFGILRVLLT